MDNRPILNDLSFSIERGETLILLGRSGSGKTTAMRLVNRILDPTSGKIRLEGEDIQNVEPIALRRRIGYVIQEFGLMPHWSVRRNVALVPHLLNWPEDRQRERVKELLGQVDLNYDEIAERKPGTLSGGQRQRVAVARALAASPGLLLFDEPFGALDPVTRRGMQTQFLKLQKQYATTSIFVTHDLPEAMAIGTKIAVLDRGRLEVLVNAAEFRNVDTPTARAFLETLTPVDRES